MAVSFHYRIAQHLMYLQEKYTKSITFTGELSTIIQSLILFAYFRTTSIPARYITQKLSNIDNSIPGASSFPLLSYALELWEFAHRYEIRSLAKHALGKFIFTLQTASPIHPVLLGPFLRINLDFDIPPILPLHQLIKPTLEALLRQFEAEITRGKAPTKAFRDIFSNITPQHDRLLARLLDEENHSFLIARRCPVCYLGAEHPSLICSNPNGTDGQRCSADLGLVAYQSEEMMEKFHWCDPPKLKPGRGLFCWCDGEVVEDGIMIKCDGIACPTKWFHVECVRDVRTTENRMWFCGDCNEGDELLGPE